MKEVKPVEVDLNNPLQISGYTPNPALCHAFVFVVEKNITDTVIGVRQGLGIRVPITSATIQADHPMAKVYGEKIVLVDKKYVSGLWMPGRKKELLAALAYTNARIFNEHKWSAPQGDNIKNPEISVDEVPQRVLQLLDGGVDYGFKAARNAANRQNKMLDKALKPIVGDLHKQAKKSDNKVKPPKENNKSSVADDLQTAEG